MSSSSTPRTTSRARKNVTIAPRDSASPVQGFRQRNVLLQDFPFLTGIVQDARPLEHGMRSAATRHAVADRSIYELTLDLACRFTRWETNSWHALSDVVGEQESTMYDRVPGLVFGWLHEIVILSTIDWLFAYAVPKAQIRPLPLSLKATQAISAPIPERAAEVVQTVFRDWALTFDTWRVLVQSERQNEPRPDQKVLASLSSNQHLHVVSANIVLAVLMIRFLATCKDAITDKGEQIHTRVKHEMTAAAAKAGVDLPEDLFSGPNPKKTGSVFVAALCTIFISPLCLFAEQPLYRRTCNLQLEYPFLIWKRIGHLERPPVVALLERKTTAFIMALALNLEGKANDSDAIHQFIVDCQDHSLEALTAVDKFYHDCATVLLGSCIKKTSKSHKAKKAKNAPFTTTPKQKPEKVPDAPSVAGRPEQEEELGGKSVAVKIEEEEFSDDDLQDNDVPFGLRLAKPSRALVIELPESIIDYAGAFEISAWGESRDEDLRMNGSDDVQLQLWDVNILLPKSMQSYGSKRLKAIDASFKTLDLSQNLPWIDARSARQWSEMPLTDINRKLARGVYLLVHGTTVGHGWQYDMPSALRICPTYTPVYAQDFSTCTGDGQACLRRVNLSSVVDPEHRDFNTVLNVPKVYQERPHVYIPRQHELNVGEHALRCRREVLADWSGAEEASLEKTLASAFNWGTISQQHAISFETINTAGVSSSMAVMAGQLIVSIHKSTYDGGDSRFNHLDWFMDLQTGQSSKNDNGNWITLLLSSGDLLFLPPCARYATWTSMDAIVTGLHFYSHVSLKSSLCGYIGALFSAQFAYSAGHIEFLSPMQAFSTLWLPSFSSEHRASMSESDTAILTAPDPTQSGGLDILLALAVVLVFNDALSAKTRPYRGAYYIHDAQSFAFIWRVVSRTGDVICEGLNAPHTPADQQHSDRSSFAGLAPFLFHVARALVCYAAKWAKLRRQGGIRTAASNNATSPTTIYARVVEGLRSALSLPTSVVEGILGDFNACVVLQTTTIFPVTTWVPREKGAEQPDARLWPDLRTPNTVADSTVENPPPAKRIRI